MKKGKTQARMTTAVHAGSHGDPLYGGLVTPVFAASAYDYEGMVRYPRYFNTPNHTAAAQKLAALEHTDGALVFSSGMAAIMTSLFAVLRSGDHIVLQNDLYGGTHHAVLNELPRFGIAFTLVDGREPKQFERAIKPNTKALYIETPSNPLLQIVDIAAVASIAKKHKLVSLIDNTFASPVNQNPADDGIDIILHSGTKYIGGHSDLSCGVMAGSEKWVQLVLGSALHFGGNLDAHTCYLVERSLKTIVLRVRQQNHNAMQVATFLAGDSRIRNVYYPGLPKHPDHSIAKRQMPEGFGGMLSFEVKSDPDKVMSRLKLIRKAISLGGVESTVAQPVKTSHAKVSPVERKKMGITDNLLRLSVGIEDPEDLIADLDFALRKK